LSVILVKALGWPGAAIATLVSLSLTSLWFMAMVNRRLRIGMADFLGKTCLVPLALSVAIGAGLMFLNTLLDPYVVGFTRVQSFTILLCELFLTAVVYVALIARTRFIDKYDRIVLAKYASKSRVTGVLFPALLKQGEA
jgi:hypothetical protein